MSNDFDDKLRERLQQSFPATATSRNALNELGPALGSARRRHTLVTGVLSLVALGVMGVGALGLIAAMQDDSTPDVVVGAPSPGDVSEVSTTAAPSDVPVDPTVNLKDGTTATITAPAPTSTPPTTTDAQPTSAPSSTSPPTTTQPTTTVLGAATTTPPTTVDPRNQSVDSDCGSIMVTVNGTAIVLIDVNADVGFEIDEKNAGPEKIEVSFENEEAHCEITAEVRDGQLWTDIRNEDE
jgi:cytoskeletal protein RodZ